MKISRKEMRICLTLMLISMIIVIFTLLATGKFLYAGMLIAGFLAVPIFSAIRSAVGYGFYYIAMKETEESSPSLKVNFVIDKESYLSPKAVEGKSNALYIFDLSIHRKEKEDKIYHDLKKRNPLIFAHNEGEITMVFVQPHGMVFSLDSGASTTGASFPFTYEVKIDVDEWDNMYMECSYQQPDDKWLRGWRKFLLGRPWPLSIQHYIIHLCPEKVELLQKEGQFVMRRGI